MRIVVVGAGPAGAAAAISAAGSGAEVTLLDRARFPRDKACGDCITVAGMGILIRLGAEAVVTGSHAIDGVRLRHGGLERGAYEISRPMGATIPRRDLDNHLVVLAVEAGATFVQGVRLTEAVTADGRVRAVRSEGGEVFEADAVIVADGATSPLHAHLLGRGSRGRGCDDMSGLAIRSYATGLADEAARYSEIVLPLRHEGRVIPGYGWVFPVPFSNGQVCANVGIGVMSSRHSSVSPRALLADFFGSLRGIDVFASLEPVGPPLAGVLRSSQHVRQAAYPNVVFAGDAAGLVNPVTGEGIAAALESGEIAGRLAASLETGGDVDRFGQLYAEHMTQRNESLFEAFRPHFSQPAGWEICGSTAPFVGD